MKALGSITKFFSICCCATLFTAAPAWAQGPLTPPGPPAPIFKTLQQIEPRTAISSLPFTISSSGSYYVTTNLAGTSGINVNANNVSIDLGGFTLDGAGSGSLANGINVSTLRTNIYIANGVVRNWGGDGVEGFSAAVHLRIENVHSSHNGGSGFDLGRFCEAKNCSATRNGENGFDSNTGTRFIGCTASTNGGFGIGGSNGGQLIEQCTSDGNVADGYFGNTMIVKDSIARRNGRHGFALSRARVTGCISTGNATNGINSGLASFISDCLVDASGAHGIQVDGGSRVINNHCYDNGRTVSGAGILVTSSGNHIENNRVSNNDRGIDVTSGQNLIIRNSAQFNAGLNYVIVAGNTAGPFVNSVNIGTNCNPHANYDF